jgi:biopolymer transport protein ExbD
VNFKPRRSRDVETDINITSLVDVVFLLLIFFMVSTTFVKKSEIDLTLPQASAELRDDPVDTIAIAITRGGDVFVNDRALVNAQVATIRQALQDVAPAAGTEPVVVISADAGTPYQVVVDVMDAARQIGLYRITFPTRVRAEAE